MNPWHWQTNLPIVQFRLFALILLHKFVEHLFQTIWVCLECRKHILDCSLDQNSVYHSEALAVLGKGFECLNDKSSIGQCCQQFRMEAKCTYAPLLPARYHQFFAPSVWVYSWSSYIGAEALLQISLRDCMEMKWELIGVPCCFLGFIWAWLAIFWYPMLSLCCCKAQNALRGVVLDFRHAEIRRLTVSWSCVYEGRSGYTLNQILV